MRPMTLREFRDLGLLQECNRRVLHPAGVALSLRVADIAFPTDDGHLPVIATFFDSRGEPAELPNFAWIGKETIAEAAEKAASVDALHLERRHDRERRFGVAIQPVEGHLASEPVTLASDDETVDLCLRLAADAIASCGLGHDEAEQEQLATDLLDAILLRVIGPLVSSLRLFPGGTLAVPPPVPVPTMTSPLTPAQLARCRYLAKELPRLAADHMVYGGFYQDKPSRRLSETELLPAEVEEALAMSAKVCDWPLANVTDPEALRVFARLEDLFSLAQPGMRFWRGLRPDITAAADSIQTRLDAYRAARNEFDRYLAGELAAHELTDPASVRAALEARVAPMREALASLDAERVVVVGELTPVTAALGRLDALAITESLCPPEFL